MHHLVVLVENLVRRVIPLVDQPPHSLVNLLCRVIRVVPRLPNVPAQKHFLLLLAIGQRPKLAHAVLANHLPSQLRSAHNIVARARRHAGHKDLFRAAPTHQDGQLRVQIILRHRVLVLFRQVHRHAQRHTARNDRHLMQRVGVVALRSHQHVSGLVVRRIALVVLAQQHGLPLSAHQHLVLCHFEVEHVYSLAVEPRRRQRRLVHHVRKVRAGKARCSPRQNRQVHILGQRHLLRMHLQNLFTPANVRTVHNHAPVETSRPQQRRIEHIRPVRRGNQNHAVVGLKPVHLDQQLIQRLLALIVSAAQASTAVPSHSVNLIDEDDAGSILLTLLK